MTVGSILAGTWDLIRREWRAVLAWSAVSLALSLAMRAAIGPVLRAQADGGGALPPWWAVAILYLLFVVGVVALYTASFRAALLPEERHAFFLRIGMDEVRVIGLIVLLYVGLLIATLPLALVGGLVAVAFAATAASQAMPVFLLVVGVFLFMAWVGIRLSTAFPLTVLRGRIVLKEAWRLTRGHVWTLFGAYVLGTLAMGALSLIVLLPLIGPLPPLDPAAPDAARLIVEWQAAQMSLPVGPAMLLSQLIGALLGGLMVAVLGGMPAVATAQMLRQRREDDNEFRA